MKRNTRIVRLDGNDEDAQIERLEELKTEGWHLCGVLPASNGDVLMYLQRDVREASLFTKPS